MDINNSPNKVHPDFHAYCGQPMKNSMYCEPVSKDELLKLINSLKNGKSPGFDNIGPKVLKQVEVTSTRIINRLA